MSFTRALAEVSGLESVPVWVFGIGMFLALSTLCLITLSYTNVYNKHADPLEENETGTTLKNEASH